MPEEQSPLTDNTPEKPESLSTTVKAAAAGLSPMALVMALPEPYATWVLYACVIFACAGLAATQIPVPASPGSKLLPLYRILNFLAANWKYAANTAMALRSKATASAEKDLHQ